MNIRYWHNPRLLNYKYAPKRGTLLAYYQDYIKFCSYRIINGFLLDDLDNQISLKNTITAHLFDKNKEYRAVYIDSDDQYIEAILDSKNESLCHNQFKHVEHIILKNVYKFNDKNKIKVVYYYEPGENGCLQMVNYRLAGLYY